MSRPLILNVMHLAGTTSVLVEDDSSLRDFHYSKGDTRVFGVTAEGEFVYALHDAYLRRYPHMVGISVFRVYRTAPPQRDPEMSPAEFVFVRELMKVHGRDILKPVADKYKVTKGVAFGALFGGEAGQRVRDNFQRGLYDIEYWKKHPFSGEDYNDERFEERIRALTEMYQDGKVSGRFSSSSEHKLSMGAMVPRSVCSVCGATSNDDHPGCKHLQEAPKKSSWLNDYARLDAEATHRLHEAQLANQTSQREPTHTDLSVHVANTKQARQRYNDAIFALRKRLNGHDIPGLAQNDESRGDLDWPELKELKLRAFYEHDTRSAAPFVSIQIEQDPDAPMGDDFFVDIDITGFGGTLDEAIACFRQGVEQLHKMKP